MNWCSEAFGGGEQAHPQVPGGIDLPAVHFEPAVGDPQHQLAGDDALDVDGVLHQLRLGQYLAGELHLAHAQRPAMPGIAQPAEVETDHLPHGVQSQAAWHHRVAGEVAFEEPEFGLDVEFGDDLTLAVGAAPIADVGDTVHHQHVVGGQLGVPGAEEFSVAALDEVFFVVGVFSFHLPVTSQSSCKLSGPVGQVVLFRRALP